MEPGATVAIQDGRFISVGTRDEIMKLAAAKTKVIGKGAHPFYARVAQALNSSVESSNSNFLVSIGFFLCEFVGLLEVGKREIDAVGLRLQHPQEGKCAAVPGIKLDRLGDDFLGLF